MHVIGCAVIGAGFMGSIHAASMRHIPSAQLKWVVDKELDKARALAEPHKARYTDHIDPVLNDPEVTAVIHCLPTPMRLEFLKQYVAAQKHILCEKPLARTLAEARAIKKLLQGYKKVFMVGQVVRFFWEYEQTRQLVRSGAIGTPGVARFSRCGGFPRAGRDWYGDYEMSGGAGLDLSVHEFDYMLWTFGPIRRVFAKGLAKTGLTHGDYMLTILKFANGMIAHSEVSWAEPLGSFWTSFEVSGSKGMIEFDSRMAPPFVLTQKAPAGSAAPGIVVPQRAELESPYPRELKHFIQCCEKNKKPLITVEDGLRALTVSLSCLESIETGRPVTIK
jgi:UDP-N-acetylglucosamine 3-dehydrogenase